MDTIEETYNLIRKMRDALFDCDQYMIHTKHCHFVNGFECNCINEDIVKCVELADKWLDGD